jgi:CubicO group peptidase (beta-lactamase class C family)
MKGAISMVKSSISRRRLVFGLGAAVSIGGARATRTQSREPSQDERIEDAKAFSEVQQRLLRQWTDIQSVVVLVQGRTVYNFYRDGDPDRLRDVQSVVKSALCTLVGVAMQEGLIGDLDRPVISWMPEWQPLNAEPRTRAITVRHLLTMTAGFAVQPTGRLEPAQAWGRPVMAAPGDRFLYDNAIVGMIGAIISRASGLPLQEYARRKLVEPLGMLEPTYLPMLNIRTQDMAKLGQLFLQGGQWGEKRLLSADFIADATRPHNSGGPPVGMPYGYLWWSLPGEASRRIYMASGYGGQLLWVNPGLETVVAATSVVSDDSQRRGQSIEMLQRGLVSAADARKR